ncbi:MAG: hypothetical protein R2824_14600 [Saprospiraceae bacterium]
MPGWAGSSWYWYRYMDPDNKGAFASKNVIDYWQDVDLYVGGSEHATGHLYIVVSGITSVMIWGWCLKGIRPVS